MRLARQYNTQATIPRTSQATMLLSELSCPIFGPLADVAGAHASGGAAKWRATNPRTGQATNLRELAGDHPENWPGGCSKGGGVVLSGFYGEL